jgi:hypothetical protein
VNHLYDVHGHLLLLLEDHWSGQQAQMLHKFPAKAGGGTEQLLASAID